MMKFFKSITFRFLAIPCVVMLASIVILGIFSYSGIHNTATQIYTKIAVENAEKAASLISGDEFEEVMNKLDESDPTYKKLANQLIAFKKNTSCKLLTSISFKPTGERIYVVDGTHDKSDPDFARLGEITEEFDEKEIKQCFSQGITTVAKLAYSLDWGWTISAYTPIRNSSNNVVGVIEVDIELETLASALFRERIIIIIIAILAVAAIFICLGRILKQLLNIQANETRLSTELDDETQTLVVTANEVSATSQDQNAAVKEIVATMEDTNCLSKNIACKIQDVTAITKKTSDDVANGADALLLNVKKLHEISDANQKTISGIKSLGDVVSNIWDIVSMITSVADEAKIIAFNAELEASSAGESGKNFHIVASEIRRLANGIIDSTKEIKDKITEVQTSSDSLILVSESGTLKVSEGCEIARELEEKFESIKKNAQITATSAQEISTIIEQQTSASGQILLTLKQISAGVASFSTSTEVVSSSAMRLKTIATKLNELNNDTNNK